MYKAGWSFVGLLTCVFLFGCNSDKTSLEAQIKEDLHKVLQNVSQIQLLSKRLTAPPPVSGMLTADHMDMYVWVTARTMQLYLARKNNLDMKVESAPGEKPIANDDSMSIKTENDSEFSKDELTALKELELDPELYLWVKTTIDNTVGFIDATGESDIADLVTFYDPIIKHNIILVKKYREKLKFAEVYSSSKQKPRSNLKVILEYPRIEKINTTA